MAGRYDNIVFEIWNKQGLSEAVQYYLFNRIGKKYNNRFYSVEYTLIWNEGFDRYFKKHYGIKSTINNFRFELEKESRKNVFEFGNKDCINVMHFSMDEKFLIE